jgi:outer membrane protein TolC
LTEDLDQLLLDQMSDLSGSIENNLQLDLLRKQKQLSEYDLKNKKMSNLPSLGGFFNHQYNSFRNEFNFFDSDQEWFSQTVWGLRLSIPIFSSGERWAKMQKAKIAIKQDELSIQQLERGLQAQEIQLKNNLKQARTNLDLKKQNVELARKIYNNSLTKAEIGKENSIMVTQKYNQLVGAQTEYVSAMLNVFNTKIQLDELYNKLISE